MDPYEILKTVNSFGIDRMLHEESAKFILDKLLEYRPSKCVEIGVNQGRSTVLTGLAIKDWEGKLYAFDPYLQETEQDTADLNGNYPDHQYRIALSNLDEYGLLDGTVTLVRMKSDEGAKIFMDNYIDWVYIDGDHTAEGVKLDIDSWVPKTKIGGKIVFDDMEHPAIRDVCATETRWKFLDTCGHTTIFEVTNNAS